MPSKIYPNKQLYLRKLSPADGRDIFEMLKTIKAEENAFTNPVYTMDFVQFKHWLVQQDQWAQNKGLPPGFVGQSLYWLFNKSTPVGVGKIRYALTTSSRKKGGNIGYAISSLYRGKGYGNEILKLLLLEAKNLKLKEILLTVEKDNYPSKKVIEKNGGILFDETDERWYFNF